MDKKAVIDEHSPKKDQEIIKPKKRAPTALTVECGVCHGPAPDHVHFGGRCCYSCRAFFRRTAPPSVSLRCRSGVGKCEISSKNKKCISCRYDLCLLVGMDPHLVQGRRTKSGKDTEGEDVQLTEEEPGGNTDKLDKTINADIPIMHNIPIAKETLQVGNITEPVVKFPGRELNDQQVTYHDKYSESSLNSANQQKKLFTGEYFPQMKSDQRQDSSIHSSEHDKCNSSFVQYPYMSFPSSSPSQYHGLGNNMHNIYNFDRSYEQRRRMLSPYRYLPHHNFCAESRNRFTKGPTEAGPLSYVHQTTDYESNTFMLSSMEDKLLNVNPDAPFTSNQQMQHNHSKRASVIRNSNRKQPSELQYKADMLKHEGSILRHTGNLFSYHAHLLERERQNSDDKTIDHQNLLKHEESTEIKTELPLQHTENDQVQKKTFSEEIANKMFLEAQELINNSHWLKNITQMNAENEYNFLAASSKYADVDSITDLQFASGELSDDFDAIHGSYRPESSSQTSVIQSHGLSSIGEKNHKK